MAHTYTLWLGVLAAKLGSKETKHRDRRHGQSAVSRSNPDIFAVKAVVSSISGYQYGWHNHIWCYTGIPRCFSATAFWKIVISTGPLVIYAILKYDQPTFLHGSNGSQWIQWIPSLQLLQSFGRMTLLCPDWARVATKAEAISSWKRTGTPSKVYIYIKYILNSLEDKVPN